MEFQPFKIEDIKKIEPVLKNMRFYGSDYCYASYLAWFESVEFAEDEDAFYFKLVYEGETAYFAPLMKEGKNFLSAFAKLPLNAVIMNASREEANLISERNHMVVMLRAESEYIYSSEDLRTLKGKKYHGKRNHVERLMDECCPQLDEYEENDKESINALLDAWFAKHQYKEEEAIFALNREKELLNFWIDNRNKLNLFVGLLHCGGNLMGISIGEISPSGVGVVMYEKADADIDGAYPTLNYLFANKYFADVKYINRQEDMGLEGLRKAKQSYHPVFMSERWMIAPYDLYAFGNPPKGLHIEKLGAKDLDAIMNFYDEGIEALEDKKFFMNYQRQEMEQILNGGGHFFAAFSGDKIVSSVCIDCDPEYGAQLKAICVQNSVKGTKIPKKTQETLLDNTPFFEFSGVMTATEFQHKGVANSLCRFAMSYAKLKFDNAVLCGVVQFDNQKSLSNFKNLGFVYAAQKSLQQYLFDYLLFKI